jgi:2-amino-4-hydroxy-6-hydroxymethyldihydropteridine diphosphokinase
MSWAVAIGLGSNLSDRRALLQRAIDLIAAHVERPRVSRFFETEPVGVDPQPLFLNAALAGETRLSPRELLDRLLDIETQLGRTRPHAGAPRTLDLDLLLYDDWVIDEPGLQVPHPRFRERHFVLAPLAEVAPDMVDPVTGLTVVQLLGRL